jgi:hypothetical protein
VAILPWIKPAKSPLMKKASAKASPATTLAHGPDVHEGGRVHRTDDRTSECQLNWNLDQARNFVVVVRRGRQGQEGVIHHGRVRAGQRPHRRRCHFAATFHLHACFTTVDTGRSGRDKEKHGEKAVGERTWCFFRLRRVVNRPRGI